MTDAFVAIVNPAAGGGRARARVPGALDVLRGHGMTLDVRETRAAGDATRIARDAWSAGARRFLAVGGDGTAHEVLNGLFPAATGAAGDTPIVGMLPLGTGNSFLRDFGITDTDGALRAIGAGRTRDVDLVRAEHAGGAIHYANILSIGFSARVGALTNARLKPLGTAGYGVAVVASVARLHTDARRVRLDGGAVDDRPYTLLSFSNSKYTGGTMMMAPDADTGDGALDVIRVGPMSRTRLLRTFPKIFRGTHVRETDVEARRAARVDFDGAPEEDVMIDGEIARLALRSLTVLPRAFRVLA